MLVIGVKSEIHLPNRLLHISSKEFLLFSGLDPFVLCIGTKLIIDLMCEALGFQLWDNGAHPT